LTEQGGRLELALDPLPGPSAVLFGTEHHRYDLLSVDLGVVFLDVVIE
jgi:hypothetical protein